MERCSNRGFTEHYTIANHAAWLAKVYCSVKPLIEQLSIWNLLEQRSICNSIEQRYFWNLIEQHSIWNYRTLSLSLLLAIYYLLFCFKITVYKSTRFQLNKMRCTRTSGPTIQFDKTVFFFKFDKTVIHLNCDNTYTTH